MHTAHAWLAEPHSGPQQLHEDIYMKLLVATRVANGDLKQLLSRQKRAYLQRLRDLNQLEERARKDGRNDLARMKDTRRCFWPTSRPARSIPTAVSG